MLIKNRKYLFNGFVIIFLFFMFVYPGGALFAQPAQTKETPNRPTLEASAQPKEPNVDEMGHEIALGAEATFVGLSWGLRLELLADILPGDGQMLRFAPGFLYGLEFLYVPVALGYRGYFGNPSVGLYWIIGAGVEYQLRWVVAGPAAHQGALYLETGAMLRLTDKNAISLHAGMDWAVLGPPGPGLTLRVVYQWLAW